MNFFTLLSGAAAFSADINECLNASSCADCVGRTYCAWCAPTNALYPDHTSAGRCFDGRDKGTAHGGAPTCHPRAQTSSCEVGWVCGGPPNYQCYSSGIPGEGTPDFKSCSDGCGVYSKFKCDKTVNQCKLCSPHETDCTSHDDCADSCIDVSSYSCNKASGQCEKCPHGKQGCVSSKECSANCEQGFECDFPSVFNASQPPKCVPCTKEPCSYSKLTECSAGTTAKQACQWHYGCDKDTQTCTPQQFGDPTKDECEAHCSSGFTCEESAPGLGQCKNVSGSSPEFHDLKSCNASCPSKPTNSTPYEVRGVWRGLAIQNSFDRGEWVANVSEKMITIWAPDGSIFIKGTTQTWSPHGGKVKSQLIITATDGIFSGEVHMIFGDRQLEPELEYVAFAVDTKTPKTAPKDWDPAMTTAGQKLLGMYKCKEGGKNCKFHLPKPTPPPVEVIEVSTLVSDPCQAFTTCDKCVNQVVGQTICGWCSGKVFYNASSPSPVLSPSHCSGWDGTGKGDWKCYGDYSTGSCPVYYKCGASQCEKTDDSTQYPDKTTCDAECGHTPFTNCSFDGVYRGLQIDIPYKSGEWDVDFDKKTSTANFTFVPTGYSFAGKIQCKADSTADKTGEYQMTLPHGQKLVGLYAKSQSDQVETEGLTLAQANQGAKVPPKDFDTAMQGTQAIVYGLTKCLDYKQGICKF